MSVPEEVELALEVSAAWLERWASHVGSCRGDSACTCGLAVIRNDVALALAIIHGTLEDDAAH